MNVNISDFKTNLTIDEVIDFYNISGANFTNESEVSQIHLFDLYEAYKTKEKEQLLMYKWVAYILGTLIVLSNLTVVVSSGLILRKGQQPKSTYLLLGNVSLADTIIGISIIFGASVDNSNASNQLCIFQLGMLVCPAMVSIFSVGLIAVDRYIYILHGLYYQRWFNTTRVRIGIVCIWMIGIVLGFMPFTGWTNKNSDSPHCYYVTIFPPELILFNSILSIIPIVMVTILYLKILIQALKNLRNIKATEKSVEVRLAQNPKLRIYRGNNIKKNESGVIERSSSCNMFNKIIDTHQASIKSKSIDDLSINTNVSQVCANKSNTQRTCLNSSISVCTVESNCTVGNSSNEIVDTSVFPMKRAEHPCRISCKLKEPKKLRAVTIVMLTLGSFIVTWMPFFIIVIFFVALCEDTCCKHQCLKMGSWLTGPIATLAIVNSALNPLIYAWWHKGFKKSIKCLFRKCMQKYFSDKRLNIKSSVRK